MDAKPFRERRRREHDSAVGDRANRTAWQEGEGGLNREALNPRIVNVDNVAAIVVSVDDRSLRASELGGWWTAACQQLHCREHARTQ
jgi:hypothetical protein